MWFTVLIIGLAIGAGLLALVEWLRRRKIKVTWYEWLLGALGLLLVLFTIQNFTASFAEHEPQAGWTFLWLFGVPAVLLIAIACLLPYLRHHKTE